MAASEVLRDISPTRILVVDDSQVMRRCLRRLLERHPHWKVYGEAPDGREAVQKAQQVGPDVIVLDFQMPEMNGLDAARSLQEQSPRVPILMVSAHMSPQLAEEARKVGIRGVCAKSDVFCVVEAVQTLLHNGTYFQAWGEKASKGSLVHEEKGRFRKSKTGTPIPFFLNSS
jgi:DNA-binding NarL/FixJ family response regulator